MDDTKPATPAPTPGQGNGVEDAAAEAVRELEKRGEGHAGTGDIG
jgi:hypothetical protein